MWRGGIKSGRGVGREIQSFKILNLLEGLLLPKRLKDGDVAAITGREEASIKDLHGFAAVGEGERVEETLAAADLMIEWAGIIGHEGAH